MDAEVNRLAAAKLKAQRVASERGQTCSELHAQCQYLKERLRVVLQDQRRLVAELGLAQQKGGDRSTAVAAGNRAPQHNAHETGLDSFILFSGESRGCEEHAIRSDSFIFASKGRSNPFLRIEGSLSGHTKRSLETVSKEW